MGFNNDGVKVIAERAKKWRTKEIARHNRWWRLSGPPRMLVGGNIGKNKVTPNEDAWKDYEICFNELFDAVDYFVVNVSSPNTPGLRELQEKAALGKILSHLISLNKQKESPKPLLLKIAPDLSDEQVIDVVDLALELELSGLVVANTTISREDLSTPKSELEAIGAGGLSGNPLTNRTIDVLKVILVKTDGILPVIASGGIFTPGDAFIRFAMGANLVQVWTGFVYEGPSIVRQICEGLAVRKIHFTQPALQEEEF
jgi:dihydroorotate dehydrogenase